MQKNCTQVIYLAQRLPAVSIAIYLQHKPESNCVLILLRMRFALPPALPQSAVVFYTAFSPLPF